MLTQDQINEINKCIARHTGSASNETIACSQQELPARVPISTSKCLQLCNSYIEFQFVLNKEQYQMKNYFEERWLFHVTGLDCIDEIKNTNLDYRKADVELYGTEYSVSFSTRFDYANMEVNAGCTLDARRVAIIAKVLIGKKGSGRYTGSFDTTDAGDVVLKYCDNEFYPKYLVYYTDPFTARFFPEK